MRLLGPRQPRTACHRAIRDTARVARSGLLAWGLWGAGVLTLGGKFFAEGWRGVLPLLSDTLYGLGAAVGIGVIGFLHYLSRAPVELRSEARARARARLRRETVCLRLLSAKQADRISRFEAADAERARLSAEAAADPRKIIGRELVQFLREVAQLWEGAGERPPGNIEEPKRKAVVDVVKRSLGSADTPTLRKVTHAPELNQPGGGAACPIPMPVQPDRNWWWRCKCYADGIREVAEDIERGRVAIRDHFRLLDADRDLTNPDAWLR